MKPKSPNTITIGMFGTCGGSQWRTPLIQEFEVKNIEYFNPVVPKWDDSFAPVEAQHLVEDEIILFPVTDETYGAGSLAEVGLSIAQAIKSNDERFVVIYVAPKVSEELQKDAEMAKESNRARALTLAHLQKQKHKYPNVFITNSLEEMKEVALHLYDSMLSIKKAREICNQ